MERVGSQLDDRQYGALKNRSTTHALIDMLHQWHSAVDRGQGSGTRFPVKSVNGLAIAEKFGM